VELMLSNNVLLNIIAALVEQDEIDLSISLITMRKSYFKFSSVVWKLHRLLKPGVPLKYALVHEWLTPPLEVQN